ncbi:hypothetical protein EBT31_06425 [bacterium]|nr:hypothetical protein [bacterium]
MKPLISIGSLIDTSFEHYRKHLPSILGITLWLLVAAIPSAIGILLSREGDDLGLATWASFGLNVVGGVITVLASLHISVALILAVREQRKGKSIDPRVVLRKAFSLDLSYIWAMILKNIFAVLLPLIPLILAFTAFVFALRSENTLLVNSLSILAFIAILIALGGAIKFSLTYNFVPYATVLEGKRGMESLRTSATLVRGRWWETFWRSFLPKALYTLIFVVALGVILWVTGIIAIAVSQESFVIAKFFALLNFFISTLVNAFMLPLLLLNDYYLYDNLQETHE